MAAMSVAIELEPERIVLLTDGEFDPLAAAVITQQNTSKETCSHRLCWLGRGGHRASRNCESKTRRLLSSMVTFDRIGLEISE